MQKRLTVTERFNKYSSINITDPELRWYVVYVITNNVNNKQYVGQAVSHIKCKNKYIPYGAEGRLKAHFLEANSNKEHQCTALNNAIREHGKENFTVDPIYNCSKKKIDELEIKAIQDYNSMFPNGYNIMRGGRKIEGYIEKDASIPRKSPSLEHRLEMAERTRAFMRNKKMNQCLEYFKTTKLLVIQSYLKQGKDKDGFDCYMLNFRGGESPIRAIFGGQHISLENSLKKCNEFYAELKEKLAKHLDAGNSLRV